MSQVTASQAVFETEEIAEVLRIAQEYSDKEKASNSKEDKEILLKTDIFNVNLSLKWQGDRLLSTVKINGKQGE